MKRKLHHRAKGKRARTILRLPDLEHAKTAVLNSLTNFDSHRGYRHAIDEFVDLCCSEPRLAFNRTVVMRYRSYLEMRQLAPGTINLRPRGGATTGIRGRRLRLAQRRSCRRNSPRQGR